jgi:Lysyl oxidase
MKKFCFAFLMLFSGYFAQAQCPSGQIPVRLEINPDEYFEEVSWTFTNGDGSILYSQGQCANVNAAVFNYCLPDGGCVVFKISDSFGDGIIPDGNYKLFVNNVLIHNNPTGNYGIGESVRFNCPQGSFCDNPFTAILGTQATPMDVEAWYVFTPVETGTYKITTCGLSNSCATKIWVYDHCSGITVSNNQTGANFYSDGGCVDGADATLYLAGGAAYYIRIKYSNNACAGLPINFTLSYEGPIVGCTDPLACNYNPLATVSADCIFPGSPECPDAPDLIVMEDVLKSSMFLSFMPNSDQCAVDEGCLRGLGNRYIINFTTHIKNIGTQDYYIGTPPSNPNTPTNQFVYDNCHNHWHYRGYADYILFAADGTQIPIGSKNGFCVLDLECGDGGQAKYSCGNMGVTAGCGDIYDSGLPCQWIDITDLPAGVYTFVVRVNWDQDPDALGRVEKTFENNWAQACFELSYDTDGTPIMNPIDDCPTFTDCNGIVFGDAREDCAGVCAGTSLHGDINQDSLRNSNDVTSYLANALSSNQSVTSCSELNENGVIDVFDAALLQECVLHADEPAYWGSRFPCTFPTGVDNIKDIVYLLPGNLDTVAKTFDVQIVNPYNKLIGYQFSVSGLEIESVENLPTGYNSTIQFTTGGEIISLSADESVIKKNILPNNLLRIHYSTLTAWVICVSEIQAVINSKYQRSEALLGDPNCVVTGISGTKELNEANFAVFAQPNPFSEQTDFFFNNPKNEAIDFTLTDITGRICRTYKNIRSEKLTLERGNLISGIYVYLVRTSKGTVSGKITVE